MSGNTKLVKIRETTKDRLDRYIKSCNVRLYLGDLVDYAVNKYLDELGVKPVCLGSFGKTFPQPTKKMVDDAIITGAKTDDSINVSIPKTDKEIEELPGRNVDMGYLTGGVTGGPSSSRTDNPEKGGDVT